MARTILGALIEHFSARGLDTQFPGGIWLAQAPETTALPVIVLVGKDDTPEWTTEASYQEDSSVQLVLYGNEAADLEELRSDVHDAYDWQHDDLVLVGGKGVMLERTRSLGPQIEDFRDSQGNQVFRCEIDYDVRVVWQRP